MLGMGKNVSLATGNGSEALLALIDGVPDLPRAVSDGLLREGAGRPHRRPEGWLEGQGDLDDLCDACSVPRRGRKGTTSKLVKFQVRNSPLDK